MYKILFWLGSIPSDKLLHFIAGAMAALLCTAIYPDMTPWCVVAAVVAGIAKEAVDQFRYGGWDWLDLAATVFGGLVVQIIVWL